MRSIDWTKTPLGPPASWPVTLRTTVGVMLSSTFAMRIAWGPEYIFLHNDGYRPVLGQDKYPAAMSSRTSESFAEVWGVVGPMFDRVMRGEAFTLVDSPLPLLRHGYLEEAFFTLSYSPLSDDRGGIGGVFAVVHEVTSRVLLERRLEVLRRLASALSNARTTSDVAHATAEVLGSAREDCPFALLYLQGVYAPDDASLAASAGLANAPTAPWPVGEIHDVTERLGPVVAGAYPEAITQAVVLPLGRGPGRPLGQLVVGVNPRKKLDSDYASFFELVREQVVAALANAVALVAVVSERARLQSLLLGVPAMIAICSGRDLVFDLVNERYCRLVGRKVEDLLGKTFRAALPEIAAQGIADGVEAVFATGVPYEAREGRALLDRRGDGTLEECYFDWLVQTTHDARGATDGVMIFAVEVSEQVHARRRVEESRAFLEGVVNQIPAGIVIVEAPSGKTLLANALADTIYGHPAHATRSVEGFAAYDVRSLNGERVEPHEFPVIRALAGELVLEEELTIERPDRSRRTVLTSASPVYDADRKRVAAVSAFVDITDRKKMEQALRDARSAAETASRAKDEFLAIVSHELRNPLNAMLGWTRLLRSGTLPEERTLKALETIERNAVNQAQLIEDLLDISRVIVGKLPLDVQTVTFARVIEAALDSARPAIDAKGLRLSVVLDTDGTLSGDPVRLQQVVWNLLTNATKFTPKGGSIRVALHRHESQLELRVSDSGQGIDPSFVDHVFDRFKQADPSTTRQHGGLGLGLSIAKNLVEMHGGTIDVQSEGLGKGATFTVRLPVAAMRRSPAPSAPSVRGPVDAFDAAPALKGLHVLVVDDEKDAREIVAEVLLACGALVRAAGSVAEARILFDEAPPDILLSDIGMPGADGYSLIAHVRSLSREAGGSVPAACLTGYTTGDDRRRALDAGFNMHLSKPIEPNELVAVAGSLGRMARALKGNP